MDMYSLLRQIADSWVLLAMFIFFAGVAIWAFLPSQAAARADAQMIPFRDEASTTKQSCKNASDDCASPDANAEGPING